MYVTKISDQGMYPTYPTKVCNWNIRARYEAKIQGQVMQLKYQTIGCHYFVAGFGKMKIFERSIRTCLWLGVKVVLSPANKIYVYGLKIVCLYKLQMSVQSSFLISFDNLALCLFKFTFLHVLWHRTETRNYNFKLLSNNFHKDTHVIEIYNPKMYKKLQAMTIIKR